MGETVLVGLGCLLVVATALPLLHKDDWWVRIFDFPRLQIAVLTLVVLVIYLGMHDGIPHAWGAAWVAALAVAVAYQGWRMFPYTPFARVQVQRSTRKDPSAHVSLVFSNVLMPNREAPRLLALIKEADPDIVLAVEADDWWRDALSPLEASHPYTVLQPIGNTYGMLLYSRLPLEDAEVKFLVEDDIPSVHARLRLRDGTAVALRCLHPRPPAPQESDRSTERDAELLIVGKALKALDMPAIVFGDLNDVAWSHTTDLFRHVSGLLDPRVGRGFFPTFNANWPLVRFPLDHCFHSPHFRLVDFRRLPRWGSDHFPVYIALSHEPAADKVQPHPHADAEEQREAAQKIAKV